jgi:hypothetical protein
VAVLWSKVKDFVDSATGRTATLERLIGALLTDIGVQLAADTALRDRINRAAVSIAGGIIAEHRSGLSSFIADQVKLGHRTIGRSDREQCRKGPAIYPLQRCFDRWIAGLLIYSTEAPFRSAETLFHWLRNVGQSGSIGLSKIKLICGHPAETPEGSCRSSAGRRGGNSPGR